MQSGNGMGMHTNHQHGKKDNHVDGNNHSAGSRGSNLRKIKRRNDG